MSTATMQDSSPTASSKKGLRIGLWIAQALLFAAFGMAGVMKSTAPIAELAKNMAWVGAMPEALVRFIGVSELLGAIGLLAPALTRIKPGLTALAGAALALVMVLAAGVHLWRGELEALPVNVVLGGVAAFVAWGRWKAAPITPRS
ncbi:MAG: DoxX family protein [Deltaproteobacteria bacterium]|nr:DoxX family protein [Deltaproteobacteria bacterium]